MRQVGLRFFYGYRLSWLLGLFVWQLVLGNVLMCVIHCQYLEHAARSVIQFTVVCDTDVFRQQLVPKRASVSSMNEPSAVMPSVLQPQSIEIRLIRSWFFVIPTVVSQSQIRFQPPLPPPRLS